MQYSNIDKQALKTNAYRALAKIYVVDTDIVFTEDDYIVNWNYEDYRYVPNTGFIGQFVERLFDGNLRDVSDDITLEDKELRLEIGIVNNLNNQTTWYDYGNFLVTKFQREDTTGKCKFEACDYAKKFNKIFQPVYDSLELEYPCLASDLLNFTAFQAGVDIFGANYNNDMIYIATDTLSAGDYYFRYYATGGQKYMKFTLPNNIDKNSVICYTADKNKILLKTVIYNNGVPTVTRSELPFTIDTSAGNYTRLQYNINSTYIDFPNFDFVIESNQYDSDATLRKVVQDIAKLAYSWARIGEDNKLHIDFTPKQINNIDQYDQLTTDEYYVSKKGDLTFGPVNKVLIGMSNVDGENMYKTSQDYTPETECAIKIWDNNLTNTDELRAIALYGAERLFGLTYTPIEIDSIGHPWLEGDELIKLTNVDNEVIYTYPFNRSIKYAGYIEGKISSEGMSKQNSKYEYTSDIISSVRKTAIEVDKENQRITALAQNVSENTSDISQLTVDIDGIDLRVQSVEETEVTGAYNEYAKNTSPTNPPAQSSSSWSTTAPTRGEGEYIWARIKTTYKQGNPSYSDPVCTTGDKGDSGGAGADGAGIDTITDYYAVSNSNETAPSSWTTDLSSLVLTSENRYLWNYEIVTYTQGKSPTGGSEFAKVIGVYGDTGDRGTGVWTSSSAPTTPNYTFTISALSGMSGKPVEGDTILYSNYKYTISSVSTTTVLAGNRVNLKGTDGTNGKWYSGTGITGTSTTATVFSNSGVSSAVVGDMYLNTDTQNTYRCTKAGNANVAEWVFVSNIKGENGRGISNITEHYLATNLSSGVTKNTSGWTTTIQTMTTTNRFLWNYETITYTSGTTTEDTTPCIIGVLGLDGGTGPSGPTGPQGPTGPTGKGIKSVTDLYYVSNSSDIPQKPTTHVTTSSLTAYNQWNLQCPPYTDTGSASSSYKYFFTCSEVEYDTNPSTYGWTNVTQNQGLMIANQNAYNAVNTVNNMEIGGTNLLENSSANLGDKSKWINDTASMTVHSSGGYMNLPYFNYAKNLSSSSSRAFLSNKSVLSKLNVNDKIIISGCYKNNTGVATSFQAWIRFSGGGGEAYVTTTVTTNTTAEWTYFEAKGTITAIPSNTDYPQFQLAFTQGQNHNIDFCAIKVEKGTKHTSWSPAPEDTNTTISSLNTYVDNNIQNLQNQIDGAIQFWNGSAIPTLNNYPASGWTTEAERTNHQADIYTVIQDVSGELKQGKSYRFDKVSGTWQWIELTDNELSAVQALANSKAKVYVTTPTVPYNVGDLWLKNNKLYKCKTAKTSSGSYAEADWELATDYTDDTVANQALNKINNLQIGGRNYALQSEAEFTITLNGSTGYAFVAKEISDAIKQLDISTKEFTFSYEAYAETSSNTLLQIYLRGTSNNVMPNYINSGPATNDWKKYTVTQSIANGKTVQDIVNYYVRVQGNSGDIIHFRKIKIETGNTGTDWSPAPEDTASESIPFINGTQTANTRFWTGNANFTELKPGQQITYWNPLSNKSEICPADYLTGCAGRVDSSHTYNKGVAIKTNVYNEDVAREYVWLNLTLADGSTTGWIPCYLGSGASRLTSQYNGGRQIHFTYLENACIGGTATTSQYTGWFAEAGYNTDTVTQLKYTGYIVSDQMYVQAYSLIGSTNNGYIEIGANNKFKVDRQLLYANANIGINGTSNNNFISLTGLSLTYNLGTVNSSGILTGAILNSADDLLVEYVIDGGNTFYRGTTITGTNRTAQVFSASGISSAAVGDYYRNTSTGYMYRCTTAGAANVAKWQYVTWTRGDKITGTNTTPTVYATGITTAYVGDLYMCINNPALNTSGYSYGNVYVCTLGGNASTAKWKYIGTTFRGFGHLWFRGTAITGTNTTPAIFSGSGIVKATVGDYYFNTNTGYYYKCTTSGAANAAKWAYEGIMTVDKQPLYLKGKLSGGVFETADVPFTTNPIAPTGDDDDYYYMLVGTMYSYYQYNLAPDHPIYKFYGGELKSLEEIATYGAELADSISSSLSGYVTRTTYDQDWEVKKGEIYGHVAKEYVTATEYGSFKQTAESTFTQIPTSTTISQIASQEVTNRIGSDDGDGIAGTVKKVKTNFVFDVTGLEINTNSSTSATEGNPIYLKLEPTQLSFKSRSSQQGEPDVVKAYMSSNSFVLNDLNTLKLGKFAFVVRTNGSIDFKKVEN